MDSDTPLRLAIVDDEEIVCRRLGQVLSTEGFEVETFTLGIPFLNRMAERPFDIVFLDIRLPDLGGLEILSRLKAIRGETEVIIITGFQSVETAVEALHNGAFHYVSKPVNLSEIRRMAQGATEKIFLRKENQRLRNALNDATGLEALLGTSPVVRQLTARIQQAAAMDCNLIISGWSGTGKALVARAIHRMGPRKDHPFLALSCGGFADELIGSELFGDKSGEDAGAANRKTGLLEAASGGTLLINEIEQLSPAMQERLLLTLEKRQIVGAAATQPIALDIRVIATTSRDLEHEVETGAFHERLFAILGTLSIALPPLSERQEDIPLLIRSFIEKYSLAFHKQLTGITPEALQILTKYNYPGNVRELEIIIERAVAHTGDEQIGTGDLPKDLQAIELNASDNNEFITLDEMEREYIRRVLQSTENDMEHTARILDISQTALLQKVKNHGLD